MTRLPSILRDARMLCSLTLTAGAVLIGLQPIVNAAGGEPTIGEWLNQTLHLRETVQAFDRPAQDGKPSGQIRAGAEIKAVGIVSGGQWVQIELPDRTLAYLPRAAVELDDPAV